MDGLGGECHRQKIRGQGLRKMPRDFLHQVPDAAGADQTNGNHQVVPALAEDEGAAGEEEGGGGG